MPRDYLRANARLKVIRFTFEAEDGTEVVHDFPAVIVVCGYCGGTGVTTEHIDGHGISMEEWDRDWDEESRDDYLSGKYDKNCPECKGQKVVLEINRDVADQAILRILDDWTESDRETEAMHAAERRMGA